MAMTQLNNVVPWRQASCTLASHRGTPAPTQTTPSPYNKNRGYVYFTLYTLIHHKHSQVHKLLCSLTSPECEHTTIDNQVTIQVFK